jgi:hypothetical protein
MSLDTLIGVVRASACLAGPLSTSGDLYADGGGTAKPLTAMMSPASEQVQMLQGQGVLDGRRATLMLAESAVTTAISRALHPGDEWVVEAANLVRGGWQRADLRWERMATATSAQEKR